MRIIFCLALFAFVVQNSYSQSYMTIDADNGIIKEFKQDPKSDSVILSVILPETGFSNVEVIINKDIFAFTCEKEIRCHPLFAVDIDSGRILFHFKGKSLVKIGTRYARLNEDVLSEKDSIAFNGTRTAGVRYALVSGKKEPAKPASVAAVSFQSAFCKDANGDSTVNGFPDFSFLCDRDALQKCKCGIPVKSRFENMYLPPCFDRKGNAVSVKNILLFDMFQSDPMRKEYLLKVQKGTIDSTNDCHEIFGRSYQFASVRTRMSLRAGDLFAVTVIAHKDSSIVIDSNYVNYFLDSAMAVQNAFTAAGNKGTAGEVVTKGVSDNKDSAKQQAKDNLQKSVTLRGDLIEFNAFYGNGSFVQEEYLGALRCLQDNIVRFFKLNSTPRSGDALAASIERIITIQGYPAGEPTLGKFVCGLLNDLSVLYDSALTQKSNYRMFTQIMQVPNADELTVGMRTSKSPDYFGRHNFLIRGGMKLDFSTGVFLTGLNNTEFVNISLRFPYRPTDTVGAPLRDTTGNLIQANRKKLNYTTGFLVHIYPRSGGYMNVGGVTGVTFNNSEFMFMAGASTMFRMGNARLAVVGGAAFGKQKHLDANQQQYLYDEARYPVSKTYIQDDVDQRVPRFFTDTNISTYDKLKVSWFAGITYNFASIKL